MPADYLSYWKRATVQRVLEEDSPLLGHAASEQYDRLAPGDTVWIVTTWSGGHLMLLGPILVDQLTDRETAARVLGTDDLWEASHHILAPSGREAPARDVDLSDIAAELRFESPRADRLDLSDPAKVASQLQAMRRLTPASAALLRERWGEEAGYADALADAQQRGGRGAGFGSAASNAEVERAAVERARADLEADGWAVRSVERDRIGYDLLCTRAEGEERHVEVKGTRGPTLGFIITEGEVRRAEEDPDFWLYLVTSALGSDARLHRYGTDELLQTFTFVPLAYRAVPAVP